MKLLILITLIIFGIPTSKASGLDRELLDYIQTFKLKPLEKLPGKNEEKYKLGKKLFFDNILSGNKNISCASCHDPKLGTSDGLPLSLGEDGISIVPRNSPALYNLGYPEISKLFWDGRVSYQSRHDTYNTPSEVLNGDYPERWDITETLGSALAAQALFPLLSHTEMRGKLGKNEIANAKTDEEAWSLILKRVLADKEYRSLFKKVYPNIQIYNIGHIANALAHFQKYEFLVTETPWDQYLRGDKTAMSDIEKKGAIVFFTSGQCISCHNTSFLGGTQFENISSPQIGPGKDIHKNDEGKFLITGREIDRYKFRVPMLRNVALTAPYFHAGAYQKLEDVIDHYTLGTKALDVYRSDWLSAFNLYKNLFIETDRYKLFKKKINAHPLIKGRIIKMTNQEKRDLLKFLKRSLTEKN